MTTTTRRHLIAGVAGLALAAALAPAAAEAQTRTLRLSHHLAPGHLVDTASNRFAELVAEATGGAVKIEVFPAGQIAGLRQGAEAVQVGTVDLVWTDMGTLANWKPEYGFVSLPFLFDGYAHANAFFNGEGGAALKEDVRASLGVEILGFGNAGFRVIATRNAPVHGPGDLAGVRIRVPEVPVYVNTFRAVGANPTPMAWGEVYTALQTGVIDAVENPPEGLVVGGMHEVTRYVSKTFHIMTDVNLAINAGVLASLTPAQQEAIRAAGATAVAEYNAATEAAAGGYWATLAERLEENETPDIEAFRAAMAPVWSGFESTAGAAGKAWIERVAAAK